VRRGEDWGARGNIGLFGPGGLLRRGSGKERLAKNYRKDWGGGGTIPKSGKGDGGTGIEYYHLKGMNVG